MAIKKETPYKVSDTIDADTEQLNYNTKLGLDTTGLSHFMKSG